MTVKCTDLHIFLLCVFHFHWFNTLQYTPFAVKQMLGIITLQVRNFSNVIDGSENYLLETKRAHDKIRPRLLLQVLHLDGPVRLRTFVRPVLRTFSLQDKSLLAFRILIYVHKSVTCILFWGRVLFML